MFFDVPDMFSLLCFVRMEYVYIAQHIGDRHAKKMNKFQWKVGVLVLLVVLYVFVAFLSLLKISLLYYCPCGVSNLNGCAISADSWQRLYRADRANCGEAIYHLN